MMLMMLARNYRECVYNVNELLTRLALQLSSRSPVGHSTFDLTQ